MTRKQLANIELIRLSVSLDTMNDAQFETYCKSLDKFILNYPDANKAAKEAFEARDQAAFSRRVLAITGMLANIGVNDYAQAGIDLLGKYREGNFDETAALLGDLLTTASTLSIDIQMAKHKNPDAAYVSEDSYIMGAEGSRGQKTILAVDDVSFLLNTLKSMLADTEYKFVGAISGAAALKYLSKNKPDLCILDIEMPVMNGYELAGKIRALGCNAPIIFLTGNATNDYVKKALKAGAADFIVKPVNREYVLGKIKKFI